MIIRILPDYAAESYSKNLSYDNKVAIISITTNEEGDEPTNISNSKWLFRMRFHDITEDLECRDYIIYAPTQTDFVGLKSFVDCIRDYASELWIHCGAGVSRSPALAAAVMEYLGMDSNRILKSDRFIPNPLVYKLAKIELGVE